MPKYQAKIPEGKILVDREDYKRLKDMQKEYKAFAKHLPKFLDELGIPKSDPPAKKKNTRKKPYNDCDECGYSEY